MYTNITSQTKQNLTLKDFFLCTDYDLVTRVPTGILGASKGTCTFKAVPTIRKADVNGVPSNTKGFAVIDAWEDVSASLSMVELTPQGVVLALGNASSDTQGALTTISPSQGVVPTSRYSDLWVIGYKTDCTKYAIKLSNALNETGFTLSTEARNNGSYDIELKANYADSDLCTPPFVIYFDTTTEAAPDLELESIEPADASSGAVTKVVLTFNNEISTENVQVLVASTGEMVGGAKQFDLTKKILTFTPTSAFDSVLHLVVIAGVVDVYGQALATATKKFTVA